MGYKNPCECLKNEFCYGIFWRANHKGRCWKMGAVIWQQRNPVSLWLWICWIHSGYSSIWKCFSFCESQLWPKNLGVQCFHQYSWYQSTPNSIVFHENQTYWRRADFWLSNEKFWRYIFRFYWSQPRKRVRTVYKCGAVTCRSYLNWIFRNYSWWYL